MDHHETSHNEIDTMESPKKQKLFSDETYNLLMESQQTIYEKTGIRITLRIILDKLINAESIHQVTDVFIQKLTF